MCYMCGTNFVMEKAEDSMGDQLQRLNRYEVGFKLLPILVSTFNGCQFKF